MSLPLPDRPLTELTAGIHTGAISAEALMAACLERIQRHDATLHAFITVVGDQALAAAREVDARRAAGAALPPLAGIPIGVKDSIPTAGLRTTANSRLRAEWVPTADAAPIRRLRAAGAIIIGKTNLNEFGWALPLASDLTPPAMSPWNPALAAIGSSSGAGVAVAAGMCAAAVGTDGGGSARLPAGQAGLVGLKPTHGRVSRLGMDNSTMSEISPLTHTVADAALMLQHLAGFERDDPQSWPEPLAFTAESRTDLRGITLGVPESYVASIGLEAEVAASFDAAITTCRDLGATIVPLAMPELALARAANFIVLNAEAHTAHAADLRQHGDKYGDSARRYHWLGAFLAATDYLNARAIGIHVRAQVEAHFATVQGILTPVSPVVTAEAARQPGAHRRGVNASFTAPFNLTGHPALSVPAGLSTATGLPIGVQFTGPLFAEPALLQMAAAFEQATPWTALRPRLVTSKERETA